MSVESTALSRSKLEQKDRSELAAIVEAMGGKATSRAKKADLVDLVLRLAGADLGPAPTAANGSGVEADERTAAEASLPAPPAPPEAGEARARPTPPTPSADDGKRSSNATGSRSNAAADPGTGTDSGPAQGPPAQDDRSSRDGADGDPQVQGEGQGQGPQQGQGGPQGEGDSSRRRRRRGRDRGRERDGQPAQPGQQGSNQSQPQGQGQGQAQDEAALGEPVEVEGYLDLREEGYGFLRLKGFLPSRDDVYVSVKQARQFGLRKGDYLKGASRPASRNEKNPALLRIDSVNDQDPELARDRRKFEDLTPLFPDQRLRLELADDPSNMTARIIDLISPIGRGQRGLIVSPPKAGKTTVMKQIARSIEINSPDVHLIVLLVDERPEEVTDMKRWLLRGEVAASTFDRPSEEHTQVAELTIERAKRMVEHGHDVVIILDGITRLARAYNLAAPATGRIMSGGVDSGALYPPKKFFGAARNIEEGGSLTILATALVETGSRMDEVIFEEFKGTGNMELRLDRRLAERRIYPAIDVDASSTRHEELLFPRLQLQMVWKLRRVLSGLAGGEGGGSGGAGLELLIDRMKTFKSNDEFLAEIAKAPSVST
ncbi:MAG: transcription termination factor Rho [Acidimicrobiia bacterium]